MATNRARPLYEINRLASDELSYKLTCRGCTGTGTVADIRTKLRIMLKLETWVYILIETECPFSFAQNKLAITEKIEEIRNSFKDFQTVENSLRRKIEAKLIHALGRLQNCQPKTVKYRNVHRDLKLSLGSVKHDFNKLKRLYEHSLRGSTVLGVFLLNLSDSSGSEDNLVTSTPIATSRSFFRVPSSMIILCALVLTVMVWKRMPEKLEKDTGHGFLP
ncbi:hypothetical protein FQA39_LY03662 [Lamprigera yunnana]|nr:hypothetical protein FQA39_LY03662 [Lamprigera yunnana]